MKEKLAKICDQIFSIGMLLALLVAFLLFLGFIVSFFTGHDAAAAITTFLYKTLLPKTYVFAVIVCLIGLIAFAATFALYITNGENKLIYYVVRPFLNKHYDSQVRDRRIV